MRSYEVMRDKTNSITLILEIIIDIP